MDLAKLQEWKNTVTAWVAAKPWWACAAAFVAGALLF